MKRIRKIYYISIVTFFGMMLALSIFVWYQRSINTPVVDYVYIHQGTIKNQEQPESEGKNTGVAFQAMRCNWMEGDILCM